MQQKNIFHLSLKSCSSHDIRYWLQIDQVLQFSAFVICDNQYNEILFFNKPKIAKHYNIMVPGPRGPAGSPWKYKKPTGWGINTQWHRPKITRFMGPTWGPPGSCRPQMGPILAPWTLRSGAFRLSGHTIDGQQELAKYHDSLIAKLTSFD